MRRWYVPLTVLGLGGVSAFLLSERGRAAMRHLFENFQQAPERWLEWNDSFENEMERIQDTLNKISDSIDPHPNRA